MGSGPTPPDAQTTSDAQTKSNIATGVAQQNLNQINQVNPFGSQTYSQIGTNADGTPKTQVTTSLAPQFANLPNQVGGLLAQPYKDYSADRDKVEGALMGRLNPQFDRDRASLEQNLANKGIHVGSAAYNASIDDFNRGVAEGRTSAVLAGGQEQSRLSQLEMAQRGQGVNELTALATGGQVQTPQSGVAPTDVSGNINNQYQQQKQQSDQMWNGIGSVGSALGGWAFSSEKLKTDIDKVGETDSGTNIYSYRYKGSPMMQMGVLAEEVKKKQPEAVRKGPGGFLQVDYNRVR